MDATQVRYARENEKRIPDVTLCADWCAVVAIHQAVFLALNPAAVDLRIKMDKKARIKEYKGIPRPMGVYQIKNTVNGKVLIGSSNNLAAILNRYRAELKMGKLP